MYRDAVFVLYILRYIILNILGYCVFIHNISIFVFSFTCSTRVKDPNKENDNYV